MIGAVVLCRNNTVQHGRPHIGCKCPGRKYNGSEDQLNYSCIAFDTQPPIPIFSCSWRHAVESRLFPVPARPHGPHDSLVAMAHRGVPRLWPNEQVGFHLACITYALFLAE
jgi:hypothetical protein